MNHETAPRPVAGAALDVMRADARSAFWLRLRNIGHLLTGNAAEAVMALAAIALTARGLGPADYGILVLAFSYARAIERLISFQSWQPLVRYGAALQGKDGTDDMRSLFKFGLVLDLGGAFLAWGIGLLLVLLGGRLFGWSEEVRLTLFICCAMLPFRLNGAPTAALRLFGRYRSAAWGSVAGTVFRLAGSLCVYAMGGGLVGFALVWGGSQALGNLLFLWIGLRALKAEGVDHIASASLRGIPARFEGIWRFAWSSNISLTLRSSANQLDILIVGAFAGPAAAGLYHIAKRAGRLAEQVSVQAQAVLFPDVSRQWAVGDRNEMRRAVKQLELVLLGFGLVGAFLALLLAKPLIELAMGPAFVNAASLLVVQMFAVTAIMTGSGSRSGLLAMGRHGQVLRGTIASTALFHATAFALVPVIGAMGANIAHLASGILCSLLFYRWFRKGLQEPGR